MLRWLAIIVNIDINDMRKIFIHYIANIIINTKITYQVTYLCALRDMIVAYEIHKSQIIFITYPCNNWMEIYNTIDVYLLIHLCMILCNSICMTIAIFVL